MLLAAVYDLGPKPGGSKPRHGDLRRTLQRRMKQLEDGHWEELLEESLRAGAAPAGGDAEARFAQFFRHARNGAFSRANRVLTSLGLASLTEQDYATLQLLLRGTDELSAEYTAMVFDWRAAGANVQLDARILQRRLRRKRPGGGCGQTGERAEHLQLLLGSPNSLGALPRILP